MGCDIHPHLEVKIGDEWIYLGEIISWRDYEVFGILSGVRNTYAQTPYFETQKRLEKDISDGLVRNLCRLFWIRPTNRNSLETHLRNEALEQVFNSVDLHSLTVIYEDELREFVDKIDSTNWRGEYGIESKEKNEMFDYWLRMTNQLMEIEKIENARIILWYDN